MAMVASALVRRVWGWTPAVHMPKLQGKVVIVTGGNSGLGFEACRNLTKHGGATVVMAVRDISKGSE